MIPFPVKDWTFICQGYLDIGLFKLNEFHPDNWNYFMQHNVELKFFGLKTKKDFKESFYYSEVKRQKRCRISIRLFYKIYFPLSHYINHC